MINNVDIFQKNMVLQTLDIHIVDNNVYNKLNEILFRNTVQIPQCILEYETLLTCIILNSKHIAKEKLYCRVKIA